MATTFNHSAGVVAGTSRTQLIGPVATGETVVVFAGTFSNKDTVSKAQHTITLETLDDGTYTPHFTQVPIPFGASSKCPKLVLSAGESLWVTSDTSTGVVCRVEYITRT